MPFADGKDPRDLGPETGRLQVIVPVLPNPDSKIPADAEVEEGEVPVRDLEDDEDFGGSGEEEIFILQSITPISIPR